MIWRLGATTGAVLPVAAAAIAADTGATIETSTPMLVHPLGYTVELGSLIAGLCACFAVRWYVAQKDLAHFRWTVDMPVTALALMFTFAAIVRVRPEPIFALLLGTGIGVLGAGIIAIAKRYVDRWLAPLVGDDMPKG